MLKKLTDNKITISRQSVAITNCLEPLLQALAWPGDRRHLMDALPFYVSSLELSDLLQTMETLRYQYRSFDINLNCLHPLLMPCLFISKNQKAMVVLNKIEDKLVVFDGYSNHQDILTAPDTLGTVYFFSPVEEHTKYLKKLNWFASVLVKFKGLFSQALFVGFVLNILLLSVPLFSMAIYNQIIGSGSTHSLPGFTIGVLLAITGIVALQRLQNKIFNHIGARLDTIVGNSVFERLLFLPASYTENASVSAQVSRVKDFDNIHEFFTSPLINAIFDLPFTLIFIITIAVLGGYLALVPVAMMAVYLLIYLIMRPIIERYNSMAAIEAGLKQEFTLETLQNMRVIKYTASLSTWYHRYRDYSAKTIIAAFQANNLTTFMNIVADFLSMVAAAAIVSLGAINVLTGTMSTGALIAIMMIVWRILLPVKMLFASQTRLHQFGASVRQVNTLMNMQMERDADIKLNILTPFEGQVRFNRVSFRYTNSADFAMMNVSFMVNAHETVVVLGRNGSGKSTLCKLLLGLYKPLSGNIYIDNQDKRQIDPLELRSQIGYVPDKPYLFPGSLALNLYLVKPTATEEELHHAIKLAGLEEAINALPNGLETLLDEQSNLRLSTSFLQRFSLACTYLKSPSIVILDVPASSLDQEGKCALLNAIQYFHGKATVFLITHDQKFFKHADKIILFHEGQVLLAGEAKQVLTRIPKEFFHEEVV